MSFRFQQGDRPLEGFTIQRAVGRGGFGEVYYALSDAGKEVALKYLRDNPGVELRGVAHCLNLKSPHLVSIHDVRQNPAGEWFVLMEYVAGPSLRELLLDAPGGLGPAKAAYFLREIGRGLTTLHDRGIVHRDLKPGNVFYDDGYVKIGDYGLSKYMAASQHSGQTISVGTVHYMAPEIGSGNYDRTIDIYALGVILYEMLLGKVPFAGATVGEILMKHLTAQPQVDALPAPFPDVIRKALSKDPKDRYATVADMIAAVFAAADLDASVAGFEPASLTRVAHHAAKAVAVGVPAGPPGRGIPTGSSNVGGLPPGAEKTPPLEKNAADCLAARVGRLVDRVQAGTAQYVDRIDRAPPVQRVVGSHASRTFAERLLIALMLVVGFSTAVGFLIAKGPPAPGLCLRVALCIGAIVQGVVLGCWLGFERYRVANTWLVRAIIVILVGIVVITSPSPLEFAAGRTDSVSRQFTEHTSRIPDKIGPVALVRDAALATRAAQPIALPLLLLVLLGDWPKRFYAGRRGQISLGLAFNAWLFTLIVAAVCDVRPAMPVALIGAASSLALQAVASFFPLAADARIPIRLQPESEEDSDYDSDASSAAAPAGSQAAPPPSRAAESPGLKSRVAQQPASAAFPEYAAATRVLWFLAALMLVCGGAAMFVAAGLLAQENRQLAGLLIGGLYSALWAAGAAWRGMLRRRRGFWRGFLRPLIFVTAVATVAACGIGAGLLSGSNDRLIFAWVMGIVFAAGTMLGVWLIPVPPYNPQPPTPELLRARQRRKGKVLLICGLVGFGWLALVIPILDSVLDRQTEDLVVPPLAVSVGILSIVLVSWGGIILGSSQTHPEKIRLPIRRAFECAEPPELPATIERHFGLLGYSPASCRELFWSFERGSKLTPLWHDDIHRWKTRANVAAFRLSGGRVRIDCFVDVDHTWHSPPKQKALQVLWDELDDLRRLLDGVRVSVDEA